VIKNIPYLAVGLPENEQFAMALYPWRPVEGQSAELPLGVNETQAPSGIFPDVATPAGTFLAGAELALGTKESRSATRTWPVSFRTSLVLLCQIQSTSRLAFPEQSMVASATCPRRQKDVYTN
jgi:hypothetical protein